MSNMTKVLNHLSHVTVDNMFKLHCYMCDQLLKEPGALVFSPPSPPANTRVMKYHICIKCWDHLFNFLKKAEAYEHKR